MPSGSPPDAAPSESPPPAAAPSTAPVVVSFGPNVAKTLSLGVGDLSVALDVPESWPALGDDALPPAEEVPDVTLTTRAGFGLHQPSAVPPWLDEVVLGCAKAPVGVSADTLREAAFVQLGDAVEKAAQRWSDLDGLELEPIREVPQGSVQPFSGEAFLRVSDKGSAHASKTRVRLEGVSLVGFYVPTKDTPAVVVCSLACAQVVRDPPSAVCPAIIASARWAGAFGPPPRRSWLADTIFRVRNDPTTFWIVVGSSTVLVATILAGVWLWRRGRTSSEHEHEHEDEADGALWASEIRSTCAASPPPEDGFYDPSTLQRRR